MQIPICGRVPYTNCMFEEVFKSELATVTGDSPLINKLWSEINVNYTSPARAYHNLAHLDYIIEKLLPIRSQIDDWQILTFSVAYHDIIYNILKKDNEERSAALASDRMSLLNFPSIRKKKCELQILATKRHLLSSDPDTNYFTDADPSILGSDNETYLNYTKQIRKEYGLFPDILYKTGRRKILEQFIKMGAIFKTKYFQDRFEDQARINISIELKSLS